MTETDPLDSTELEVPDDHATGGPPCGDEGEVLADLHADDVLGAVTVGGLSEEP